ncbi:MAG: hypothetical protein RAK22_02185 [Nanoarchaeota archaeon]|nr:hypothetical protein [Nanoarchaeota archaeon]
MRGKKRMAIIDNRTEEPDEDYDLLERDEDLFDFIENNQRE